MEADRTNAPDCSRMRYICGTRSGLLVMAMVHALIMDLFMISFDFLCSRAALSMAVSLGFILPCLYAMPTEHTITLGGCAQPELHAVETWTHDAVNVFEYTEAQYVYTCYGRGASGARVLYTDANIKLRRAVHIYIPYTCVAHVLYTIYTWYTHAIYDVRVRCTLYHIMLCCCITWYRMRVTHLHAHK